MKYLIEFAEDFRPFNINITTDSAVYLAAPLNRRNRVIITPSSPWAPGVGGLAYLNSFSLNDDVPCFVFTDRLGTNMGKIIKKCCSHEAGGMRRIKNICQNMMYQIVHTLHKNIIVV